jgi:SRSO17 transposase
LEHRKKAELALDMVQSARANGVPILSGWVGGDAFYGDDPEFLRQLDQMGETFMLDIHNDQPIYLNDPTPYIPD